MKRKTKVVVVVLIALLGLVVMGNQSCEKQDVITGLTIAESTMNSLYNGTAVPLIMDYCKKPPAQHVTQCKEFTEKVNPAMQEFLSITFPSMIEIAKLVIPENQQPVEKPPDNITRYWLDNFEKLPAVEQERIIVALKSRQ